MSPRAVRKRTSPPTVRRCSMMARGHAQPRRAPPPEPPAAAVAAVADHRDRGRCGGGLVPREAPAGRPRDRLRPDRDGDLPRRHARPAARARARAHGRRRARRADRGRARAGDRLRPAAGRADGRARDVHRRARRRRDAAHDRGRGVGDHHRLGRAGDRRAVPDRPIEALLGRRRRVRGAPAAVPARSPAPRRPRGPGGLQRPRPHARGGRGGPADGRSRAGPARTRDRPRHRRRPARARRGARGRARHGPHGAATAARPRAPGGPAGDRPPPRLRHAQHPRARPRRRASHAHGREPGARPRRAVQDLAQAVWALATAFEEPGTTTPRAASRCRPPRRRARRWRATPTSRSPRSPGRSARRRPTSCARRRQGRRAATSPTARTEEMLADQLDLGPPRAG